MKTKNGFTLLEILVSVTVLSIIIVLLTQVFVVSTRTNTKNELTRQIKQNGDYALGAMSRLIQNSLEINSACSETGTTTTALGLVNFDGGSTSLACLNESGILRIASVSAATAYLTSSSLTLSGTDCTDALTFVCTTGLDNSKSVQINFSLKQLGSPTTTFEQASLNFQTTVNTRNTY